MAWGDEEHERERVRRYFEERNKPEDQNGNPFPMIEATTSSAMSRIAMMVREGLGPALEAGSTLEAELRKSGYTQANAENIATEYIVVCISHFKKG
jgi:hypothetical protein